MSISESSSSLERRFDRSVLFDNTGVDDDDEGGDIISAECCRTTGESGMKALVERLFVTSNGVLGPSADDDAEYDRSSCKLFNDAVDVGI